MTDGNVDLTTWKYNDDNADRLGDFSLDVRLFLLLGNFSEIS